MYTQRQMPLKLIFRWTMGTSVLFFLNAIIPATLHIFFNFDLITVPWSTIALVGTAVAFLISFQNNAAYDRVWEARKIWGGIINKTRSFSIFARDMIEGDEAALRTILYRHRAWLTTLRYSMREQKSWEIPEYKSERLKKKFRELRYNPEKEETLTEVLKPLLDASDYDYVMTSPNKQSSILSLQSKHITDLKKQDKIWEHSYLKLEEALDELYTLQGKSERIKNFPYPRQYFTLGLMLTWTFIILLPYAMIPEFTTMGQKLGLTMNINPKWFTAISIPFVVCVSWIFHTMGRMGRAGENPFEGTIHDVPISAIARNLEIEISHFLNEPVDRRPKTFPVVSDVQM